MAARSEKSAAVAELTESFRGSSAALLTDYRGLTVGQLDELRRALGEGTRYQVVKNTLTVRAAREAGVDGLEELLAGPTAVAFVTGDPVEAARGLRDFSRENPLLVLKGGVLAGSPVSVDEIRRLADLESREVLLAKLAGALSAGLSGAASLLAAPLSGAARLAQALVDAGGPPAAAGAAPAAAPADRASSAPADEASPAPADGASSAPADEASPAPADEASQDAAPSAADDVVGTPAASGA